MARAHPHPLMKPAIALMRSSPPLFGTMNVPIALVLVSLMTSTVIPCTCVVMGSSCPSRTCALYPQNFFHKRSGTHQPMYRACVTSCSTRSFVLGCPQSEMVLTLSACRSIPPSNIAFQRLSVHVQSEDAHVAARQIIASSSRKLPVLRS